MVNGGYLVHDLELKRYKIVNQPGLKDYPLHGGDRLELLVEGRWVPVRIEILSNEQNKGTWKFITEQSTLIFPQEDQQARLVSHASHKEV